MKTKSTMSTLEKVKAAGAAGKLSEGAVDNLRIWLQEPRYRQYVPQIEAHVQQSRWKELDDAFWTVIPFGTGGRRGRMYPIGCNAINERTIGESAQGLVNYLLKQEAKGQLVGSKACAIAYDTRHRSREFAELCAEVMLGNGFRVFLLDGYRSTPELSFLVRQRRCACGIMVTASHNPPSDNAVKIYGPHGGQLVPPHDRGVIDEVMRVEEIERSDFQAAVDDGRVVLCREDVDQAFLQQHLAEAFPGPRDARILYSPLHGVGEVNVVAALEADGFTHVEVFEPHREPSGDFPNVPGHVSNPENPRVFDAMIEHARHSGADLALATDPDCDRMGAAAPLSTDATGPWATFTGNQLGALLADYCLEQRRNNGDLTTDHYLVKTLVTSDMIRRIGDSYGVTTHGDLLVGFKWIGELMENIGPEHFVLGTEESHGYLVGQYARDKDGAVACMLLSELVAVLKARGKSLHDHLDALYWQHGYHCERLMNQMMEGSDGMRRMRELLERLRSSPPKELGGVAVAALRDYLHGTRTLSDGTVEALSGPKGDLLMLDLAEEGNWIAVRASGTEPKIKFYLAGFVPPESIASLEDTRREVDRRLDAIQDDLRRLAG